MSEVKLSKLERKELEHKTRRLSIKEGMFWSVRNSFGDNYLAPFAIALGSSNPVVAIINSIWNLGPLTQLWGSKLIGKYKRKTIFKNTLLVEAISWIVFSIIGILYLKGIQTEILPFLTLITLSIMLSAIGIGHPSWFSWIGDVIDAKYRGRWFSKRNTIISFSSIFLAIIASIILTQFKNQGYEIFGFIFLFLIAFLARIYSISIIKKQYEPEIKKTKNNSLKKFLKEVRGTNFSKFTLFRGLFAMTIGLSSPLVSIYLLKELQLDYTSYIIILLSGTFFSIFTLNLWGKIADKYGNYKVIALTTIIVPLTPVLWILSDNMFYLFFFPAAIGGTAWSAFIMASGNFIYDNVKKSSRGNAVSFFNLFVGLGAFLGGLFSALLLIFIQTTWIKPIYLIFIIGTLARMIVVAIWIPQLKEIKRKQKLTSLKELEKTIIKETKPTIIEDLHEIMQIRNYLRER